MFDMQEHPHRRQNMLTGEWVLVSPHRTKRPWQGKTESPTNVARPKYDPKCYLCPGNTRANGSVTESYASTYVFVNDFGALVEDAPRKSYKDGLFVAKAESGICKVVCFSPDHSLTLPDMELSAIEEVVRLWQGEYESLGAKPKVKHVQIFENKGSIMGCSNPHPHGQIWAQYTLPNEIVKKTKRQWAYYKKHDISLLSTYVQQEIEADVRIVTRNKDFVAVVPFWAVWPYELMIIPIRHMQHIGQMTQHEVKSYATILKDVTKRFDRLFDTSFPYSSGIHQSPTDKKDYTAWHWHMSFYPPLLRSATVKKFMVGYEMFAEAQRDITAEMAAAKLKVLSGQ